LPAPSESFGVLSPSGESLGEDAPISFHFRFNVAIDAVIVRGRGNEPHRVHELIHRIPLSTVTFLKACSDISFLPVQLDQQPVQYSVNRAPSQWPRVVSALRRGAEAWRSRVSKTRMARLRCALG
jgi:hypothetical protein